MARKSKEYLEKLKKKHKVSELWSWSKYNCYLNSVYEYFLKYIKNIKEDRKDGIYSVSGGIAHNILERFYKKEIEHSQMIAEYEEKLEEMNMMELKYDRCDDEKNEKIAQKYEECLRHFFRNHIPIIGKVEIERFVTVLIGKFLFQGYIDFIHKENDCYIVTDWKTSTIYTGKKIDSEKGQLVLYAIALNQLGVPLENIKIRWAFLKYVTVIQPQAKGDFVERHIERHEIGSKLASNVKMWMKKNKYNSEDIEDYIDLFISTNDIGCLPKDIQKLYEIKDCYVYIPLSEEVLRELEEDMIKNIIEIKRKEMDYHKNNDELIWWEEITDKNYYYFNNLSGYSPKLHKPYKEYLDKREQYKQSSNDDEEDMSWLESL